MTTDRHLYGTWDIPEGHCPKGHGPLERVEDGVRWGWCPTCKQGWSWSERSPAYEETT